MDVIDCNKTVTGGHGSSSSASSASLQSTVARTASLTAHTGIETCMLRVTFNTADDMQVAGEASIVGTVACKRIK